MKTGGSVFNPWVKAAVLATAALGLSACSGEGHAPDTALIGEDEIPVHRLTSLTDPEGRQPIEGRLREASSIGRIVGGGVAEALRIDVGAGHPSAWMVRGRLLASIMSRKG